jgi:hypothetical protein
MLGPKPHRRTPRRSGAVHPRGDRGRPLPVLAAGAETQGAVGEDRPDARAGRGAAARAETAGSADLVAAKKRRR